MRPICRAGRARARRPATRSCSICRWSRSDYPASDPGPHTLLAGDPTEDNLQRLDWLLARASGYIALAGGGARFATSAGAPPVLDVLARRGLALIEIGDADLARAAAAVGLPYASAPARDRRGPLDRCRSTTRSPGSRRRRWRPAARSGVAQGYPVSLERLRLWAATLDDKGLVLAPVSAFVIERAGLAARVRSRWPRAAAASQG